MVKTQNVIIKGTKDGLLLRLDDTCSFSELVNELEEKLLPHTNIMDDEQSVHVRVHTGNRLLTDEQEEHIKQIVNPKKNLFIASIESNVILKEEAKRLRDEEATTVITGIIRSGQVINITGDLLLIGDVNPGGTVNASGNIFVLGRLKGIAHAGFYGDDQAVICAASMTPTQLRIADVISRSPDRDEIPNESECAYINSSKQLIIDRLPVLKRVRPNLNRFVEGGFHRG